MAEHRVVRRLAAILAADVVGYSRLMAADEEGTLARLNALRREFLEPAIAEHRGRVVKRTGDGLLVEFGSAVDATRCAIQAQQGMTKRNEDVRADRLIQMRIGVHIGDIIVDDGDIFGDGVNIAARLESIARPGGISISEDTWRQVQGRVDTNFVDIGEQYLKNIPRPIRVYRLALEDELSTRELEIVAKTRVELPAQSGTPSNPKVADSTRVVGAASIFAGVGTSEAIGGAPSELNTQRAGFSNLLRFFAAPLIILLVVHHLIVNAFDLGNVYLWAASIIIPFVFGFLFFWAAGSGIGAGIGFAVMLGVVSVVGMTVSQSLNSGDPIMPQNRLEWLDNIHLAVGIALGYLIGYALARALHAMRSESMSKL